MSKMDTTIFTDDILLEDGDMMRQIRLYDPSIKEFDPLKAYLKGEYFYIYRGSLQNKDSGIDEPGIYIDDKTNKIVLLDPITEEDKKKYSYDDKISSKTTTDIIRKINSGEVKVFAFPDSNKFFCPDITENDDILKRLMKRVIINKGIDIDRYKHRFIDKNALFNFKQVIKGDSRLSMLLFDRGVDAFGLKYTIILEEDGGDIIGAPLQEPIVVSSTDTFELNGKTLFSNTDND